MEEIKDEGIENIYSAVTKTKAKSAKSSAEKKCKKVEVKTNVNETNNEVDELRNNFISYVNNNNDLTPEQKATIIENVNSLTTVEQVEELMELKYTFLSSVSLDTPLHVPLTSLVCTFLLTHVNVYTKSLVSANVFTTSVKNIP